MNIEIYNEFKNRSPEKKKIKESDIEYKICERAKKENMIPYKFTSPNRISVPDRLVLSKIPDELVPVIAKYIRFIEFKAPGCKPTDSQKREHLRLRSLGFTVDIVDNIEQGISIINGMKNADLQ